MRLLQLATAPSQLLDLHPHVSVVTGLSEEARALLVEAVSRLARAEAVPGPGLLEAHGVLFDLDPALLALVEVGAEEIDPIVQAVQLPAQPISLDARELRSREDAFAVLLELISNQAVRRSTARDTLDAAAAALEQAHAARAEAAAGGERRQADLDRVARRVEALADERRRVRREVEQARHEHAEVEARRQEVEERTTAVREALDAATSLRISIEAEIDGLDEAADPDAPNPRGGEPDEPDPHIEDAREQRIRELERLLVAVVPVERMLVQEALASMAADADDELVPSAEAMRLADELDRVATSLDQLAPDPGPGLGSVAEATARLDEARQALLEAERAVRSPELDRDDLLKLEDVHGELIEAIEKADGRFGRARATTRVRELRLAEQEVLDRLGFNSYSAYMMGYSLNHTDPVKEDALDAAREELVAAEDAWSAIEGASESEPEVAAADEQHRRLMEHAASLLGGSVPDPPQGALRALRVARAPRGAAAGVLAAALDAAGIDLGDELLDEEELTQVAEAWIAEAHEVEAVRRAAASELAAARAGHWSPDDAALTPLDDHHPVEPDERAVLLQDLATAREMERSTLDTVGPAEEELAALEAEAVALEAWAAALEEELAGLDVEVAAAEDALGGLSGTVDLPDLDALLESAKAVHAEAGAALEAIDKAVATLDAEGRAEAAEIERLQDLVGAEDTGVATPAEELEWYLLARLAAQRSVSIAGSTPMLLDDALRGLGIDEVCHLLTRLERMADVVQVIVLSEDPVVASWALTTGMARAAVVTPAPVTAGG